MYNVIMIMLTMSYDMIYLMIKISDLTPRDVDILSILRKENIEYQNEGYIIITFLDLKTNISIFYTF